MEVGLEVNVEKTKYMLLSCYQNAGQNHDMKTENIYFENVIQFNIWEREQRIKISFRRKLKSRMNSYNSVQHLLSSHLMSKNVKSEHAELYLCVRFCMCKGM
jgi:hypothetical protein